MEKNEAYLKHILEAISDIQKGFDVLEKLF